MRFLACIFFLLCFSGCHFFTHQNSIEIAYGDWPIDIALANLAKAVIEENFETKVDLMLTNSAGVFASLSSGTSDVSMSAWLPKTHKYYYENTKNRVDLVRSVYDKAFIGLAVPQYVNIDSIEQLAAIPKNFDNQIIGIEPGAGIMVQIEEAIKLYDLLKYKLIETSEAVMINTLKQYIEKKEWIVIAAWRPHEMFRRFELKPLRDPKKAFGDEEKVYTITRLGFDKDYPRIYRFLKNFHLSDDALSELIAMNKENNRPYENAIKWIHSHPQKTALWLKN